MTTWLRKCAFGTGSHDGERAPHHGRHRKQLAYLSGLIAELACVLYLAVRGYRIHAWRAQTGAGELDIVASKRTHWVFVEVKRRRGGHGAASEALRPAQCARLRRAASAFTGNRRRTSSQPFASDVPCRFDFVGIDGFWRPHHVRGAF